MNREGSLLAPARHPLNWKNPDFHNADKLNRELERVYDICHGCRRCVSLCNAFPTLFDLVDESDTMEVDGIKKVDYMKVVDHCYLCDLCFMTKCPYVPPHEWEVDFPHLMLRAKAVAARQRKPSLRDRLLASTDAVGKFATIPFVAPVINVVNKIALVRKILDKVAGIHKNAVLPRFSGRPFRNRSIDADKNSQTATPAGETSGRVAIFTTCYGNRCSPEVNEDLLAVLQHNGIEVRLVEKEWCCGMPKLELGDLQAVSDAKDKNIPQLLKLIEDGWDIVAPIPSCVLMFKQELPLMFPDDDDVRHVQQAIYDPFEYLMLRHKHKQLNTEFKNSLGKLVYHASCHLRVQNIGMKTRDVLKFVPETNIEVVERCSGHDGTYAVKSEFHDIATKICRPVVNKIKNAQADYYTSDCPMAGAQIGNGLDDGSSATHPMTLLRHAYGI